jgi:hypothetical protein
MHTSTTDLRGLYSFWAVGSEPVQRMLVGLHCIPVHQGLLPKHPAKGTLSNVAKHACLLCSHIYSAMQASARLEASFTAVSMKERVKHRARELGISASFRTFRHPSSLTSDQKPFHVQLVVCRVPRTGATAVSESAALIKAGQKFLDRLEADDHFKFRLLQQ